MATTSLPAVRGSRPGWLPATWTARFALVALVVVVIGMIVVPYFDEGPMTKVDTGNAFQPPVWSNGGTWRHALGTDQLGRDILSRLAHGARVSLLVASTAAAIGCLIGLAIGLVGGYFGGLADQVASRLVEAQLALPVVLIALALVVAVGPSTTTLVVAIAIATWVPYARVARGETLVLKHSDFVALAKVSGVSPITTVVRHVLPNVMPSMIVIATQTFGQAIIYEASLSFLGIGVQPPGASWGLMIAESRIYLETHPWVVLAPAAALAITALSANILGDQLRDSLDPTLRTV